MSRVSVLCTYLRLCVYVLAHVSLLSSCGSVFVYVSVAMSQAEVCMSCTMCVIFGGSVVFLALGWRGPQVVAVNLCIHWPVLLCAD